MRRALAVLFVAAVLGVVGASVARADMVTGTRTQFTSSDTVYWGMLGANNFFVTSGSTATSTSGIVTTVLSGTGGDLSTLVQCTVASCSWTGNFAPGTVVLSDLNFNTGGDSGRITLDFSKGIAGVGFQLEPDAGGPITFSTEIAAYDGGTLLGVFYFPLGFEQSHTMMNTAGFYGVLDSTAPDITSIQVLAYNCGGPGGNCFGFALNRLRIEDTVPTTTPEPASLALLGSGLGMLGFLRRKLSARK